MPSYEIRSRTPDGNENVRGLQISDPDAAVSAFKQNYPDEEIIEIKSGPDKIRIDLSPGTRSVHLQTPAMTLAFTVPDMIDRSEWLPLLRDFVGVAEDGNETDSPTTIICDFEPLKKLFNMLAAFKLYFHLAADDDERLHLIGCVCHFCGTTHLPCYCMRDD